MIRIEITNLASSDMVSAIDNVANMLRGWKNLKRIEIVVEAQK